jgi:predicted nucleic acid-binding protein
VNYFYLDASAYAKLYYPEHGSDAMVALVAQLPDFHSRRLVITSVTIAETVAVLNRRRNEFRMPDGEFGQAVTRVLADASQFTYWRVHDEDSLSAIALISAYSLNASDALHLHTALRFSEILRRTRQDCLVLVASDRRLRRAATAEGLTTLDPEVDSLRRVHDLARSDR